MSGILNPEPDKVYALYYKDDKSDKVYQAEIKTDRKGFTVCFAYGRRGSTMTTGKKNSKPEGLEMATKIFLDLVKSKMSKGYTEGAGAQKFSGTHNDGKYMGILPQLLNVIDEKEANDLIEDYDWCLQEKKDGKRIMIKVDDDGPVATNRRGLAVEVPEDIVSELVEFQSDTFQIDGEMIGDVYHVFDLLERDGEDLRQEGYESRYEALKEEVENCGDHIQLVPAFFGEEDKREAFEQFRTDGVEGVVFKESDAPYKAGRPNSKGPQRKFKFVATATVCVDAVNAKRSVKIVALGPGKELIPIGNVTILPNFDMPEPGDMIEVRYLYLLPGGSLYQPIYLGLREDKTQPDKISSLKYKHGAEDADDDA